MFTNTNYFFSKLAKSLSPIYLSKLFSSIQMASTETSVALVKQPQKILKRNRSAVSSDEEIEDIEEEVEPRKKVKGNHDEVNHKANA